MSTLNLISYGINNKAKRIVFASSMSVYGDHKKKLKEGFRLSPKSCYGISKLTSENYLKLFSKKFLLSHLECLMFMDQVKIFLILNKEW